MNIRFGLKHSGRHIFAAPVSAGKAGDVYLPGYFTGEGAGLIQIIAYNPDGAKSAIFGSDTERQGFTQITFELTETGCGQAKLKFAKYPSFDEIRYGQRIDIHLYGDPRPWWSGYALNRPDAGGTGMTYELECHGYYNILKKRLIFKRYKDTEISQIAADVCRQAEDLGVAVNPAKIYSTDYTITDINFDGVNVAECLKQLMEFAAGWTCGVDEYRQIYFMPRSDGINEEARFWVGQHITEYLPKIDADKIVNKAYIKGGKEEEAGSQWLCTVEDTASQALYGRREEVWTLPTAYDVEDARRWGEEELKKYKDPIPSAKVKGVSLYYPKPGGAFWIRKLSPAGQAAITDKDGVLKTYPITKIKYTVEAGKGIACELELGEQPREMAQWMRDKEREYRNSELLQQSKGSVADT